jgi:hypothetical protein
MTTVFLLYEDDGESYNVIGVFTTEKLAKGKKDLLDRTEWAHRYVEEVELNKEIPA